jgi:hypothetical protein
MPGMDSPPPAPWTYAARTAYFGDRVCPFCDHHNPAGAKFCNDCGSSLHLKPCNQCPASVTTPEATPVLPAADPTPAWATPGGVGVAASVTQPLFAAGTLRAEWRLAAIATMLIAGAYAGYCINAPTLDAMEVASQPIGAGEHDAPIAASAGPMAVESKPVEPDTTAALQAPILTTSPEAPKRATARQHPVPELQARVGKTAPVAQTLVVARVGAPVAKTREAPRPDPWQAIHVSLARCGGDLIARIVCDQRVRRRFCEGHWGEAPECASGVANDRGQ